MKEINCPKCKKKKWKYDVVSMVAECECGYRESLTDLYPDNIEFRKIREEALETISRSIIEYNVPTKGGKL